MALIVPAARNTARLLDAEPLAAVYVELTCARQAAMQLEPISKPVSNLYTNLRQVRPQPLRPRVTADDRKAHRAFVQTLGSEAVWVEYLTLKECSRAA